jgi:integrase
MISKRPKAAARKQRLTELSVRKARPQAKAYLLWDTQQSHLALRVQPSGSRAWVTVYSRHGRPRWLTLGNANAIGLSDARTMAAEAMLAVAKGKDPAAERRAERGAGTFAELHAKYVEQHAKKNNKSWPQAAALINRHVLPRWGKLQASTITRGDVKAMMARIRAPIAANQTLAAVSAVFTWGVREELVSANPCKLVARNATKDRERVLAESEILQFWKAFDAAEPVAGAALKMILLTGQRPGEIAHLRREHIKDGWWELPGAPIAGVWPGTKNGQSHRIWLPKSAQAIIASSEVPSGYVFPGPRGGPVNGLDKAMRAISRKLAVEPVRPHDLRRTFGSLVTRLGFGRPAMDRILNHADHTISSVYDRHSYSVEDRHIMESVAAHVVALVEGRAEGGKFFSADVLSERI